MNKSFKKLISLSSLYSLGKFSELALSFVFIPIYTTFLSLEDYGVVGLMSITVGLVVKFVAPINQALLRFYYAPEYRDRNGVLLFNLFLLLLLKAGGLALIFWRMSEYLTDTLLGNRNLVYIVQIYALILLFKPFSEFFRDLLRLLEKAKYAVFVSLLRLLLSAFLTLHLLINLKAGVLALVLGELFGAVFTTIAILPVFIKRATFRFSPTLLIPTLKYAYPLLLAGYSFFLVRFGDRYVLKIFHPVSTVGLYSFGDRFTSIIGTALITPLQQALQPVILKQEADPKAVKDLLSRGTTYFYLVGFGLGLLLSLFSREAFRILARKEEFWGGWVIVPILTFAHIQRGIGSFLRMGMVMAKKTFHMSATVLLVAVVNLGLNFLTVPRWGMLGAAFATMISNIVWNLLRAYYSAKFYNLYLDLRRLLHITVTGCGLYGLSLLIATGEFMALNALIKFMLVLSYPLTLFITGFFHESEKSYMLQLMRRARSGIA